MTNADKFKHLFGIYATELWAMSENDFLEWLNADEQDMPTAERKTGKWIVSHIPDSMLWECNQCGFDCGAHSFNFCPNCGADMKGEKK